MTDADRRALERALDDGPRLTLLALADLCEEQGDVWTAKGYRLLAGERRHPVERMRLDGAVPPEWRWSMGLSFKSLHAFSSWLPAKVYRGLERLGHLASPTCSEAFRRAAVAWGQVLKGEAGKEATREVCPGCGRARRDLTGREPCAYCDGGA